jgi:hypothetical protein
MPWLVSVRIMRRLLPALLLVGTLALAGCVPGGGGADDDALSDEERLSLIAAGDAEIERSLWAAGGLEAALGGPDAADEVFAGLFGSLADLRHHVEDELTAEDFVFETASSRSTSEVGSTEADGAGGFLAMLVSKLMADTGVAATADGKTRTGYKDIGDGKSTGSITLETLDDGTIQSRLETHGTYKGAKVDIVVGNDIKPCPDASGLVEPRAVFQVNLTGPDGAGTSTQIVVDMRIQLDDDAGVASSDYQYEASYSARPQSEGASVFDFSTKSVTFTRDYQGGHTVSDLSVAGFWDAKFADDAQRTGDYLANWVADSTKTAAQKGWEDGRCIDLQGAYSAGPKGLKPKATVTATLKPIATSDGAPAGGTVTAELTSGVKGITPSGTKVTAPAEFIYTAGSKKDESGTVRFEARSKRGVGVLTVTFDTTAPAAFDFVGGGGEWAAAGSTCDIGGPFEISGMGLTMHLSGGYPSGTYTLDGIAAAAAWDGSGEYTITLDDDGTGVLNANGTNTVSSPVGVATDSAAAEFAMTPREPCA